MKGFEDSMYYKKQEELFEKHWNRELTDDEFYAELLKNLDEELSHPELYGTWLVYHYNPSAESLGEGWPRWEAEKIYNVAMEEARIFRKNGYGERAEYIERCAEEGMEIEKENW